MNVLTELFPIPVFPEGALTSSVVPAVWIGVTVLAFFNLRLGWTLSGLVVPGYVVPLMIAKPWAAAVVFVEGILTYLLVAFFSKRLSQWGKWNNLFGRDRFFALILASLVIRILLDGWLLPELGKIMNQLGLSFDYRNNLRSFGLIITALIANYFWKPGLRKGLISLLTITGITFLLVRYGLMELTNFNIGRIEYMYEGLVTHFLASPKAYIIIIVTSFMASRMNLRYGWEYSGIMIPALLALQWYQPLKLLATFVEAGIILAVAIPVMKLPVFRNITMEGARKLLLFFNIGFLYKFILGHVLLQTAPHLHITDFYGFGYLLSTLVAIKMHQRDFLPQMTRSILQTSLVAVVTASLIGFGLTYMSRLSASAPAPEVAQPGGAEVLETDLVRLVQEEKLLLYRKNTPDSMAVPLAWEIDHFADSLYAVVEYLDTREPHKLEAARYLLSQVNYRADFIRDKYLYIRENLPRKGWGIYLFNLEPNNGLAVEIPAPLDEWQSMEAGAWMFKWLNAGSMAIAGTSRKTNRDLSSDVLSNPRTFFHTFHRLIGRDNTLQVRTYTPESARLIAGIRRRATSFDLPQLKNSLWVKSGFPPGLSLSRLKEAVRGFDIHWAPTPMGNVQRSQSWEGFSELYLGRESARGSMLQMVVKDRRVSPESHVQRIDGYLREWLMGTKGEIAPRGSNRYRPYPLEELMFFDQELITPMLKLVRREYRSGAFTSEGEQELQVIDAAAGNVGYKLYWYRHHTSGQDYLILAEDPGKRVRRYTGTYVFRMGKPRPFMVHIPRPLYERNSFEYGVSLFERLRGAVLLIAGAHPQANTDGSSDVVHFSNKGSLFNLVNQVVLRESAEFPLAIAACRAFAFKPERPASGADVFLAGGEWPETPEQLTMLGRFLHEILTEDGLTVQFVDGSPATMGYEIGMQSIYQYLAQTSNKEIYALWLSPELRRFYRQESENRLELFQFESLGVPTTETHLAQWLRELRRLPVLPLEEALRGQVELYLETRDVVRLYRLLRTGIKFQRVVDRNSRQSFLAIFPRGGRGFPFIASLTPRSGDIHLLPGDINPRSAGDIVRRFIDTRAMWLVVTGDKVVKGKKR